MTERETDARIRAQFIEAVVCTALMAAIAFVIAALPPAAWWH